MARCAPDDVGSRGCAGFRCPRRHRARCGAGRDPPPPPLTTWSLTVAVDPAEGGPVDANVGTISCPSECSSLYPDGTAVRLTAKPADGEEFDNWLGACRTDDPVCELTMNSAKTVTAKFKKKPKK